MLMFSMFSEFCDYSSKQFYQEYTLLMKEINMLNKGKICWDYSSHSDQDNEKFEVKSFKIKRNSVATIVFQALSIESYINLYGAYYLGEKFDKGYEWQPTLKKLCSLCKDVTGKEFPKGERLYNDIKELYEKRDSLVHYKAHSIDSKFSSEDEYINFLSKHYAMGNTGKYIDTYNQLKKTLKDLGDSKHDIVEQQNKEMNKEFVEAFADMFNL